MIPREVVQERQAMPLDKKIEMSMERIREWYEAWDGKVYVSFSGGKDSTVLLNLVRSIYPKVPAMFLNTGLEYPEIKQFVKQTENVVWLRPKMPFHKVIEKYGYPVISKQVSNSIHRFRLNPREGWRYNKFINGINEDGTRTQFYIPKKWQKLAFDAPFKISDSCCSVLKHSPSIKYEKSFGRSPYFGMMVSDSNKRKNDYRKTGCNAFIRKRPMSNPIAFWCEHDIWEYMKKYSILYSKVYNMGVVRTGCMFCMFGIHREPEPNRFQRMKQTHPKYWNYCINKLECGKVLDCIGVPYE